MELAIILIFFLHDYYSACPQFNFLKNDYVYCMAVSEGDSNCLDCKYGEKRQKHLSGFRNLFHKYDITFIAPSKIAKEIWKQTHSEFEDKIRVVPHQRFKGTYRKSSFYKDKIKLAYVGYQSFNKGWDVWKYIVENIDTANYELYHFGQCLEKLKNVNNIEVSFLDKGQDAMIKTIRENDIDVVLLWSIWPETYSYTYFESYASGTFVITNNSSGNIAAQVKKNKSGIILEDKESVYKFLSDKNNVLKSVKKYTERNFPLILETNTELYDEMISLAHIKNAKFIFNRSELINILINM